MASAPTPYTRGPSASSRAGGRLPRIVHRTASFSAQDIQALVPAGFFSSAHRSDCGQRGLELLQGHVVGSGWRRPRSGGDGGGHCTAHRQPQRSTKPSGQRRLHERVAEARRRLCSGEQAQKYAAQGGLLQVKGLIFCRKPAFELLCAGCCRTLRYGMKGCCRGVGKERKREFVHILGFPRPNRLDA